MELIIPGKGSIHLHDIPDYIDQLQSQLHTATQAFNEIMDLLKYEKEKPYRYEPDIAFHVASRALNDINKDNKNE